MVRSVKMAWILFLWMVLWVQPAGAQLSWRVSVKRVLDASGNPPSSGDLSTETQIRDAFDRANQMLEDTGRGYFFNVVEIVDLVGLPAPPTSLEVCVGGSENGQSCGDMSDCPGGTCVTPASWFDAPISRTVRNALQAEAEADPGAFAWSTTAMNVYVLGSNGSGTAHDMVLLGQQLAYTNTPFHEAGHFFDLCHTHGCEYGGASPDSDTVGDDEVADTLLDNSTWDEDDIAVENFGLVYSQLSGSQRDRVDDLMHNLMAYHTDRTRITAGQLDRMTDASNGMRAAVASGRTWFVDQGGNQSSQLGTSSRPFLTVAGGLAAAASGDIVLIRAGSYATPLTINQPVTLRASGGTTVVGSQ